MMWLELALLLACILIGARIGGIGLGIVAGIGLAIFVFGFAMPPGMFARGVDNLCDVVADLCVHVYGPHGPLARCEIVGRNHRLKLIKRMLFSQHFQHLGLLFLRWISER